MKHDLNNSSVLTVTLETGRKIDAQHCIFGATYASLLAGLPNPELDQSLLETFSNGILSFFGSWPIHIIKAKRRTFPDGITYLPLIVFGASFDSYSERDNKWTRLILIWLQDDIYPAISDDNKLQISQLDWESVATHFSP